MRCVDCQGTGIIGDHLGAVGCRTCGGRGEVPCQSCAALRAELTAAQDELEAARIATGKAWFFGGVSLAEAIKRKVRMLESL